MKFSINDLLSKCDQICRNLRIWSHLMKKSIMENSIFCAVNFSQKKLLSFLTDTNTVTMTHVNMSAALLRTDSALFKSNVSRELYLRY